MKMKRKSVYVVALKIVLQERRFSMKMKAKARRSLKPLKLLWKKVTYGDEYPYIVRGTLTEYINFCRVNGIGVCCIPESELA